MRAPPHCTHDAAFQKAVGGYPRGLVVRHAGEVFMSAIDDNMAEPHAESILWEALGTVADAAR